jgi:ketosteroid isomerase-like protein
MPVDRSQVIETVLEENAAIAAGDLGRFLAVLAEDCVMMPPNAKPVSGEALRGWMASFLETIQVKPVAYHHHAVVVAGDWAWHDYVCQWQATPKAGGTASTPRFKGLHILRREGDGWKIVRNIWNTDPAA